MSEYTLPLVKILIEQTKDSAFAYIEGELDASNTPLARNVLEHELPSQAKSVYFLMENTTCSDSSSLALLMTVHHSLDRRNQTVRVILSRDHHLREILTDSGVDQMVELCEEVG